MSCARLRFRPCSKSQPGVRGQVKGPSGTFVTYCNISFFLYGFTSAVASGIFFYLGVMTDLTKIIGLWHLAALRCCFRGVKEVNSTGSEWNTIFLWL